MAVALVQSATAQSGGTPTGSLTVTLPSPPTSGNSLVLAISIANDPSTVVSVSGGLLPFLVVESGGPITLLLYKLTQAVSGAQAVTVTFAGSNNFGALYYAEWSGAGSIVGTTGTGSSSGGTVSVVGNLPTTRAPLAGDFPYGFFAVRNTATITAQAGWTQLANLNTGGSFAQLEVQQGPAASTSPQNETAQATISLLSGSDLSSANALVVISSSPPLALSSQEPLESLGTDTANARSSQEAVESLGIDTSAAHSSQEPTEALGSDTSLARASQVVCEALIPLFIRVSQEPVETLNTDTANVRVSQAVIEVVWSSTGARRRTVDDEMFTL